MTRRATFTTVLVLAAVGVAGSHSPASGQVNIGIRIGTPPPPVVVVMPPPQVVVIEPGAPAYYYDGWYYRYYNRAWFVGERHEGPWAYVPVERVPRRVLAIPGAYERIPPGHLEKVGPHPWARAEREHERGEGRGQERKGRDRE